MTKGNILTSGPEDPSTWAGSQSALRGFETISWISLHLWDEPFAACHQFCQERWALVELRSRIHYFHLYYLWHWGCVLVQVSAFSFKEWLHRGLDPWTCREYLGEQSQWATTTVRVMCFFCVGRSQCECEWKCYSFSYINTVYRLKA